MEEKDLYLAYQLKEIVMGLRPSIQLQSEVENWSLIRKIQSCTNLTYDDLQGRKLLWERFHKIKKKLIMVFHG